MIDCELGIYLRLWLVEVAASVDESFGSDKFAMRSYILINQMEVFIFLEVDQMEFLVTKKDIKYEEEKYLCIC